MKEQSDKLRWSSIWQRDIHWPLAAAIHSTSQG